MYEQYIQMVNNTHVSNFKFLSFGRLLVNVESFALESEEVDLF